MRLGHSLEKEKRVYMNLFNNLGDALLLCHNNHRPLYVPYLPLFSIVFLLYQCQGFYTLQREEAMETIPFHLNTRPQRAMERMATKGDMPRRTPKPVATPLPPLKP